MITPSVSGNDGWLTDVTSTGFIQIQLPVNVKLTTYQIYGGYNSGRSPSTWTILGSNDGTNYTQIDSQSSQTIGSSKTYSLSTSTTYSYFKLNVTSNSGNSLLGLKQWKLFGDVTEGSRWITDSSGQVHIGSLAGQYSSASGSIGIGYQAGYSGQASGAIAIGYQAGQTNQGQNAIAIGINAGNSMQGANSLAIGGQAGVNNQHSNSIILNETGNTLNSQSTNATYIAPIRTATGSSTYSMMLYNKDNKEVCVSSDITSAVSKTFVIDHPFDSNKFLVHDCVESPDTQLLYRGKSEITNESSVKVSLPNYAKAIGSNWTIGLTAIGSNAPHLTCSEVDETCGSFVVYSPANVNTSFYWTVHGQMTKIEVEPSKASCEVKGSGPYRWI